MTDVINLAEERDDREDTDPRTTLMEIQLREHGTRLTEVQGQVDRLFDLVRKIARKLEVES